MDLSKAVCERLEKRIDLAEVEVSEMTTKVSGMETLNIDACKQVFRTIEQRKADLRSVSDRVLKVL